MVSAGQDQVLSIRTVVELIDKHDGENIHVIRKANLCPPYVLNHRYSRYSLVWDDNRLEH